MSKVLQVAWREFFATVSSRAFIVGLLLLPAMGALMALIIPRAFDFDDFDVSGEVAIVDTDGRVAAALREALDPDSLAARRRADTERVLENMPAGVRAAGGAAVENAAGPLPDLRVVERPADADIEREKAALYAAGDPGALRRLALVVVHEDAVEPADGGTDYGAYDLYVPQNLDDRAEGEIRRALREAIVAERIRASGLEPGAIRAMVDVPRVRSITVSSDEERRSIGGLNIMLPAAFGALLFIGVLTGGQALLTSTVEEKSSRVIEVLLSAVSPMQLMAGKLLGQMAVSALALGLYIAMGIALLIGFAVAGLVDFSLFFYLVVFFVITYLVIGSLMMAAGSAVNEMREAQSLTMPITMMLIVPWIMWMPISRSPDSAFSVAMSFLPPINSIAMLLRMTSSSPPPAWQVWLSIAVGVASVFAALWFAAKVFRVGLLMYGKPPNFRTLIRWAREA
ncbi:MAG: ABC transporter permease [Gammaproteobacteria bacterium]|nr:ABC transporter permease [Gammaproteobacteria bacterium]